MKKKLLYISAMLLAMAACNKEQILEPAGPVVGEGETLVRLTAEIAVPTKVEFGNVQGVFNWSASGDEMAVHVSDGKRGDVVFVEHGYKTATVVPNDPATTCEFFFVMSEAQKRDFFAVYPASIADEENYGDGELKVNLPAEYEIDPAGMADWSPTPMVAVNDPAVETLTFKHIGGLLRLTLNDVSPATETITVSLGKRLTGSFTVHDPGTAVPYIETDDTEDEVSFRLTEALGGYTDGFILNVPVPTGTYTSLKVKAKNAVGEVVYSYEDTNTRSFESGRGRRAETSISAVAIPLTLEALEDGTLSIENPKGLTIEYSFDNANWTPASDATIIIPFETGDCIYLRGNNSKYSRLSFDGDDFSSTTITTDGQCYVYGNMMSLIDAENFEECTAFTDDFAFAFLFTGASDLLNHPEKSLELPATTLTPGCYYGLFFGCTGLQSAPILPATTLEPYCYVGMFYGSGLVNAPEILASEIKEGSCQDMFALCQNLVYSPDINADVIGDDGCDEMFVACTSLVSAPALKATTLGDSCYEDMFADCTALVNAPELPATTLNRQCYYAMFSGCTSLEEAPALPAETMTESCYGSMFRNCSSLKQAPVLASTALAERCYSSMFEGCTSLTAAPTLAATNLAPYCYYYMFDGCSSLKTAPELSASSMKEYCYECMFQNCTSLETAPALSSVDLAQNCYYGMFKGCTSLTSIPEILPATTLYSQCYAYMFDGCTSIQRAPVLPAVIVSGGHYQAMFRGCSSLNYVKAMFEKWNDTFWSWLDGVSATGTFVKSPYAEWNPEEHRGPDGIPAGWTVETATE